MCFKWMKLSHWIKSVGYGAAFLLLVRIGSENKRRCVYDWDLAKQNKNRNEIDAEKKFLYTERKSGFAGKDDYAGRVINLQEGIDVLQMVDIGRTLRLQSVSQGKRVFDAFIAVVGPSLLRRAGRRRRPDARVAVRQPRLPVLHRAGHFPLRGYRMSMLYHSDDGLFIFCRVVVIAGSFLWKGLCVYNMYISEGIWVWVCRCWLHALESRNFLFW